VHDEPEYHRRSQNFKKMGVAKKWTNEVNDQSNISGFIYMVLKSRDCVFKSLYLIMSVVLYRLVVAIGVLASEG